MNARLVQSAAVASARVFGNNIGNGHKSGWQLLRQNKKGNKIGSWYDDQAITLKTDVLSIPTMDNHIIKKNIEKTLFFGTFPKSSQNFFRLTFGGSAVFCHMYTLTYCGFPCSV